MKSLRDFMQRPARHAGHERTQHFRFLKEIFTADAEKFSHRPTQTNKRLCPGRPGLTKFWIPVCTGMTSLGFGGSFRQSGC